MDRVPAFTLSLLIAACALYHQPGAAAEPKAAGINDRQRVRDNCASLLYQLLDDEKDLSKLLLVKRESDPIHQVVKEISSSARAGLKQLDKLAAKDRTLQLHAPALPAGEVATRDAVSKTKTAELLHAKGAEFEFQLLLTQIEALNYGAHLAKVAGENESRPDGAREFQELGNELQRL